LKNQINIDRHTKVKTVQALKLGQEYEYSQYKFSPKDFLSPPIPGRKIVILGDTYGSDSIKSIVTGCDVLVHESTFSASDQNKARQYTHSTSHDAARLAASIGAKDLILTHFSPGLEDVEALVQEAQQLTTARVHIAHDLMIHQIPTASRSDFSSVKAGNP